MTQGSPVLTDIQITVAAPITASWLAGALASACPTGEARIKVENAVTEINRQLAIIAGITGQTLVVARPGP